MESSKSQEAVASDQIEKPLSSCLEVQRFLVKTVWQTKKG